MRILLVEDDEPLGEALRAGLIRDGYSIDWLRDGLSAMQALRIEKFDIVVLDLSLPGLPGLDVLRKMRVIGIKTPVLILTARDAKEDRILGLDSGADDYLIKPPDLDEICARLRALRRRSLDQAIPYLQYGHLKLDPATHTLQVSDDLVNLPRREFALLQKLLENPGRVLTRETLLQSLYGWDDEIDSNALEVHIHNLRKKLGSHMIRTIRGVGYMAAKLI